MSDFKYCAGPYLGMMDLWLNKLWKNRTTNFDYPLDDTHIKDLLCLRLFSF